MFDSAINILDNNIFNFFPADSISYQSVMAILEHHRLINQNDNAPVIKPKQLTALIHDIFYAAEKLGNFKEFSTTFNLERSISTLSNFLWNIFDWFVHIFNNLQHLNGI